jgi:methyl-accepting chemotaxis protein
VRVGFSQGLLLVVFQMIPAAAVLFLATPLDAEARVRLAWAFACAVVPLGAAAALFAAVATASLGRAASRLTPASPPAETIDPAAARRVRAFPAVNAVAVFVCGLLAYVICALVAAGSAGAKVLAVGVAAALLSAFAAYAAAERFLVPIYAFLTAKRIYLRKRFFISVRVKAAVAGGCGAAAVIVLANGAVLAGGARAWGYWLAAAVVVAAAAGIASYIVGRATGPLNNVARASVITYYVGDEIENLTTACRAFLEESRAFDASIRKANEELGYQAVRVRESLTEQASIASEQASAISETSVTMKELAGTVKQTASRAEEISGRVDSSVNLVKEAEDQILTNAERIDRLAVESQNAARLAVALNESARRMDEVVALVNDLAEQSTVLALNAAIEAAKAGEFGRGFSAVAREVKNLAGSSKEGTEEIRRVLHEIRGSTVKTVASARESAEQSDILREGAARAKDLVGEIVPLVEEIGRMSKQIAASARQQSLGLEQVTTAVDNINDAATEALDQAKAVRGAVESIADISSRLAEEAGAPRWWKKP